MKASNEKPVRRYNLPQVALAKLEPHPAVIGLLPPLAQAEYGALEESIRLEGVRSALHAQEDEDGQLWIIDGLNRKEICQKLGIPEVPIQIFCYTTEAEIRGHALTINSQRRQLCHAQRAVLGLMLLEIERQRAAERQRAGAFKGGMTAGRGRPKSSEQGEQAPKDQHAGEAASIVGKLMGISARTLEKAAKAIELMPELREKFMRCEMAVTKGYRIAVQAEHRCKQQEEGEKNVEAPIRPYLVIRDPRGVELVKTDDPSSLPEHQLALRADGWLKLHWVWNGKQVGP